MVNGLLPPGGFRSFNIAVAFNLALGFLRLLGSTLVFDIADHQPQCLQRRKVTTCLVDPRLMRPKRQKGDVDGIALEVLVPELDRIY